MLLSSVHAHTHTHYKQIVFKCALQGWGRGQRQRIVQINKTIVQDVKVGLYRFTRQPSSAHHLNHRKPYSSTQQPLEGSQQALEPLSLTTTSTYCLSSVAVLWQHLIYSQVQLGRWEQVMWCRVHIRRLMAGRKQFCTRLPKAEPEIVMVVGILMMMMI